MTNFEKHDGSKSNLELEPTSKREFRSIKDDELLQETLNLIGVTIKDADKKDINIDIDRYGDVTIKIKNRLVKIKKEI